jgi:tRNA dimethylallyltransferase
VDEVRQLTADGRELGRTARQAVGYREALGYLAGEFDRNEMIQRIKSRTRRFAKRQGTWFRSLIECRFVDVVGEVDVEAVAETVVEQGQET